MLPCAPHTVYEAMSWVHSLTCGPGRDLPAALSTALTDPHCHAVHLVTTGLPCHADAVLRALPAVAGGRTVTVFYLLDHSMVSFNDEARDFLRCLTLATRGSCYLIPVGFNGALMGKVQYVVFRLRWWHLFRLLSPNCACWQVVPFHMTESYVPLSTTYPVKSVHGLSVHIPKQHVFHPLYRLVKLYICPIHRVTTVNVQKSLEACNCYHNTPKVYSYTVCGCAGPLQSWHCMTVHDCLM